MQATTFLESNFEKGKSPKKDQACINLKFAGDIEPARPIHSVHSKSSQNEGLMKFNLQIFFMNVISPIGDTHCSRLVDGSQ